MIINKIIIKNYKSIKHLEINPNSGLNAFIGENSVGKSNIFDAINWLLGPVYPTFNSTKKEDHFMGDESNKIVIRLHFDDGHNLELNEYAEKPNYQGQIEIKSGLFFDDNSYNCKGEIRENYSAAYLGVDRKILDYLPSNRWSLVGRILQEINKKFLLETHSHNGNTKEKSEWLKIWLQGIRDKLLFSVKDENGEEVMKKFLSIVQEESAKQLNRPQSDFVVDLSLYDPWNFYRTLQLLVKENDMDLEFQASSLGMGVQASISIAILKAYSEINLANNSPIFIDEPELFLHPQAQRNFYKILRELSQDKLDASGNLIRKGTQVFYNTHSQNYLSVDKFNEIFICRKSKDYGTFCTTAKVDDFTIDYSVRYPGRSTTSTEILMHYKNAYENTGDSQRANEAFFAKKIILVEGQTESFILPYFFDLAEFDYIKEGISIVRCGSKSELDRFFRLYNEFGIPTYIIFDGDKQNIGTEDEDNSKNRNRAIQEMFGINADWPDEVVNDRFLGFEECIEKNLGFEYAYNNKNKESVVELFKTIKNTITTKQQLPSWVSQLIQKITNLNTSLPSVLKKAS